MRDTLRRLPHPGVSHLWQWAFLLMTGVSVPGFAGRAVAAEIEVHPASVELRDSFSRQQLVVTTSGAAGPVDGTSTAVYRAIDPAVARVSSRGLIEPVGVGETQIEVQLAEAIARIPVRVVSLDENRPVHFGREVEPWLTRAGCNAGGCHGKASGQNGFKLSLFGFDHAFDYQALVLDDRGRRVFAANPDDSLILAKGSGRAPHGGGKRFEPGSEGYRVIRRWIEQGAPPEAPDAPTVVRVRVFPAVRVMAPGASQQLSLSVEYSDGTQRDVTHAAQFDSNFDVVAAVSPEGLVQISASTGEAAITARYQGQVAVFRAIVPHGDTLQEIAGFPTETYIDRLVAEKWKKLGLLPSPLADDATYLRRVTLDLCGRLPTVEEVQEFLKAGSPNQREQAVDRLLSSADHPAYFAMRWGTILRNSQQTGAVQASYAFHNWIKDVIARNRPYDEFVRGVIAASGEWQDAPAINWYWQMRDDQLHQVTSDTAQVFLGIRLQCARCHHHPYERWGQADYYGLSGFFTRLGRKSFGEPPPYFSASRVTLGDVNPLTGKSPEPKYLDGPTAQFSAEQDPRHALVDWMIRPDNPFFAKAFVNRMWGHFMGRGLVDQVDDMRETNPASNPELLEALAQDFIAHKFDMRHIIRQIATSRVYQLSSETTDANRHDSQNHARFYARRLIAEVLHDAIDQASASKTKFNSMSASARAVDLPHEGFSSYFLDAFDRPRRVTGCECERSSNATLGQVLLLSNSDEVENKIADEQGRVSRLMKSEMSHGERITTLYLAVLSRPPRPDELTKAEAFISGLPADQQRAGFEDVLWTLVNSREFIFNH